jgi:hypothetical protein
VLSGTLSVGDIGGALGGIGGALIGLGIPEYEAKRYEGFVQEGGILLSVHVDDNEWQSKAEDLLESCGAREISSTTEKRTKFSSFKNESSSRHFRV